MKCTLTFAVCCVILFAGCENAVTDSEMNSVDVPSAAAFVLEDGGHQDSAVSKNLGCTTVASSRGTMSARVVNPGHLTNDVDADGCQVAVYFSADGSVDGATVTASTTRDHFGVFNDGANVNVTNATFTSSFVSILYANGASGRIDGNQLSGHERGGIVVLGDGTTADVRGNVVTGSGPKSSGWAENGIQVSTEARATVMDNEVVDHWWEKNDWVSSGILVFSSDEVVIKGNVVRNSDAAIYLFGNNNNTVDNLTEVVHEGTTAEHYGVITLGDNNGVRQSTIKSDAENAVAGIYVFGASNKIIRNRLSGWTYDLFDAGTDTKTPPGS